MGYSDNFERFYVAIKMERKHIKNPSKDARLQKVESRKNLSNFRHSILILNTLIRFQMKCPWNFPPSNIFHGFLHVPGKSD